MAEAWAIKLIGEAAWLMVKRYWKPVLFGLVGLSIVATIAIQHWRINSLVTARAQDKIAIDAAVSANAQNTRAIAEIKADEKRSRELIAEAAAREAARAAKVERAIQEIQSDPHASDLAGPVFDALGDRLRGLDEDRH